MGLVFSDAAELIRDDLDRCIEEDKELLDRVFAKCIPEGRLEDAAESLDWIQRRASNREHPITVVPIAAALLKPFERYLQKDKKGEDL